MMAGIQDVPDQEGPAVDPQQRAWTTAELRRAIWLAHPHHVRGLLGTPDRLALRESAAAVGVSVRTLQRWLSGAALPRPANALALRTALAPPAEVLRRQQMDRRHQVVIAAELAHDRRLRRPRSVTRQWRDQAWHTPHVMWLLHHENLGVRRLMVSMTHPVKPTVIPAGWTLQDRVSFPDRPTAMVTKYDTLERIGPWRVAVSERLVDDGRHECWLDTAPAEPI